MKKQQASEEDDNDNKNDNDKQSAEEAKPVIPKQDTPQVPDTLAPTKANEEEQTVEMYGIGDTFKSDNDTASMTTTNTLDPLITS